MDLDLENGKPIYQQLAHWLEGEILADRLREEERIYSQYQLAELFNINPATAAKSLNLLAAERIIYKKRGLGMFIAEDAKEIIFTKRRENNFKQLLQALVRESKSLGIELPQLLELVRGEMGGGENGRDIRS